MKAPDFWWKAKADGRALLLRPVAAVWGLAATRRMEQAPAARAPMPVICVGNMVVGGAGKTPTALEIGRLARERGVAPGFLARGYGGSASGPMLVDPARHLASEVGDEPLLLAAEAPTAIGADRGASVGLLARQGAELAILDDGFQNPSLAKDISLLVVDAAAGIGNGLVLPAGPLRAPVDRQLQRAAALVVVGEGAAAAPVIRLAARAGRPVLSALLVPKPRAAWGKDRLLAFAGIGRPGKFFLSLREAGAPVAAEVPFPDHHDFTIADAHYLLDRAAKEGLGLITTAKDKARLAGRDGLVGKLAEAADRFDVALRFDEPDRIVRMVDELMARRG